MLQERLTRHLIENNIAYTSHMLRAAKISVHMGLGCLACVVHAILPFLFEDTASEICDKILNEKI